ncbi:hypothetical protein PR729_02375 [Providencia rettgeri]|nr:hypothetical protein PR729_13610 [Providencia rettgeri]OBY37678.1 hypothetical protein PR729_02375 [Providencia rettgeri]
MNLPERLYYPLSEAAKKLNCTEQDIIHFGAVGALNLSIYLEKHKVTNGNLLRLNIPTKMLNEIDCFGYIMDDAWCIGGVKYESSNNNSKPVGYFSNFVSGFFYINSYNLIKLEFDKECELNLATISTGNESFNNDCIDILFPSEPLKIDKKFLCVKKEDIYNLKNDTKISIKENIENEEAPKTVAKKGELIIGLLQLIPEFSDIDPYTISASKLADLIDAIAKEKEIDIPKIHSQTLSLYLGREKKSRKK